jgi:seryl-tRNA synthetase
MQANEDATELKAKSVALKAELNEAEAEEQRVAEERDKALIPIGNIVHDSVPIDDDEV